ncbi:hypothetical protein LTR91_020487 [Friedmanniomyces endolithicus]|uniref:Major royal jelly protein n=1 Tax=Friedmanniomyces endolithicus TaxID=329885 RepID=A0AAN6HCC6_9PEZI|nr:hypothetical protein LTS09_016233 [Friedmanniomyces endolithicus]KAK0346566.1 hypothetical protein LTR94_006027 [Friedmanniomyces endolithicus]KAK0781352.1 hypothetical protein LTR38_013771 [Friedmanniomyces endolithicus]KAK0802979.1 hypothetical protein LTR59_004826 [Friedmanniomyces endolithicus]KAK0846100.1 hypothetical protein LTR03_007108 [Friedmanniomyces endolithicus]
MARFLAVAAFGLLCSAQRPFSTSELIRDPGVYGPPLELVHLYYDSFPTGIAVSASGRLFSNYPGALDKNDTYAPGNGRYTIAELVSNTTESPYPSAAINSPPGGAINYTTYPPSGAGYSDYFIGSQSIVIDALDRAWVLDTGNFPLSSRRCLSCLLIDDIRKGTNPERYFSVGDLRRTKVGGDHAHQQSNSATHLSKVAFPDSYLNDVRFDLRKNVTASGKGVAYITDSSVEGRNGIIIVDLGTGESWRHLDGHPSVRPEQQYLSFQWGIPLYANNAGKPFGYNSFGADGISLSADGESLFWKAVGSRYLFSIPTARLRDNSATSEVMAQGAITNHGQTGQSDGFEVDTNGYIYHGNMEQNAIGFFNPANGTDQIYVRDPLINWVDTFSTGTDGYLYFTVNQLDFGPGFYSNAGPVSLDMLMMGTIRETGPTH